MNFFSIHKKLQAFTLLELLVGMIISTIVVAATFSAYHIVAAQYKLFDERTNESCELSFFISGLQADLAKAIDADVKENEIDILKDSAAVTYLFNEKYSLRKTSARTDTLHVCVENPEMYIGTNKVEDENALFDRINLALIMNGKKEICSFSICRSAKEILKTETADRRIKDGN